MGRQRRNKTPQKEEKNRQKARKERQHSRAWVSGEHRLFFDVGEEVKLFVFFPHSMLSHFYTHTHTHARSRKHTHCPGATHIYNLQRVTYRHVS